MSEYEIEVTKKGADYATDTVVKAGVTLPDWPGLELTAADAVAIVANGAVSTFTEGIGRVIGELGRRAARERDKPIRDTRDDYTMADCPMPGCEITAAHGLTDHSPAAVAADPS